MIYDFGFQTTQQPHDIVAQLKAELAAKDVVIEALKNDVATLGQELLRIQPKRHEIDDLSSASARSAEWAAQLNTDYRRLRDRIKEAIGDLADAANIELGCCC